MTVFDTSKMVPITKKKLSQDIVKCIRISPFNEALIASCSSFNVEVINLRMGNQAIPIVQKEPVSAISWHPKNPILVSCFSKIDYVYSLSLVITYSIFLSLHAQVVGYNEKIGVFHISNK